MKKLSLLLSLLIGFVVNGQITNNPTKFYYGTTYPNAQSVSLADSIPVMNGNQKINFYIDL